MIVTIAGQVGSGKSKVLGANALVHAHEGKKVVILDDEHRAEQYFRANEHLKLDMSNMDITVIPTRVPTREDSDLIFGYIQGKLMDMDADVVMLDIFMLDADSIASRLQHYLSAKRNKLVTVYVAIQTRRGLTIE